MNLTMTLKIDHVPIQVELKNVISIVSEIVKSSLIISL